MTSTERYEHPPVHTLKSPAEATTPAAQPDPEARPGREDHPATEEKPPAHDTSAVESPENLPARMWATLIMFAAFVVCTSGCMIGLLLR